MTTLIAHWEVWLIAMALGIAFAYAVTYALAYAWILSKLISQAYAATCSWLWERRGFAGPIYRTTGMQARENRRI